MDEGTLSHLIQLLFPVVKIIYNLLFHHLRRFPGPLLNRSTVLVWIYHANRGYLHKHVQDLHHRYGPVVRIAPNELSFLDKTAWKDIYGHRVGEHGGLSENAKSRTLYSASQSTSAGLLSAPRERHTFLRKSLSHGFSDQSLREQESIILGHVDLFLAGLRDATVAGGGSTELNMADWFAFLTFDIIGKIY